MVGRLRAMCSARDVGSFRSMARYGERVEELKEIRAEYLAYLSDPARTLSQGQWAKEYGVTEKSLRDWRKNPEFQKALDERLADLNIDSVRIQMVIDALHKEAAAGNTRAAQLYLDYVKLLQPQRFRPIEDLSDPSAMSDADLAAALRAAADGLA